MLDDFSTKVTLEEYYESLIQCDSCGRDVLFEQIHYMQSFDKENHEFILCHSCYRKMLGEKINDN